MELYGMTLRICGTLHGVMEPGYRATALWLSDNAMDIVRCNMLPAAARALSIAVTLWLLRGCTPPARAALSTCLHAYASKRVQALAWGMLPFQ